MLQGNITLKVGGSFVTSETRESRTIQQDKSFGIMTHAGYQAASHAKPIGTWNLHNAAQEVLKQPSDFFAMLSIVSGVVGTKVKPTTQRQAPSSTLLQAFVSRWACKPLQTILAPFKTLSTFPSRPELLGPFQSRLVNIDR